MQQIEPTDPITLRPHTASFSVEAGTDGPLLNVTISTAALGDFLVPLNADDAENFAAICDAFATYATKR
jgi:hypothetical protein